MNSSRAAGFFCAVIVALGAANGARADVCEVSGRVLVGGSPPVTGSAVVCHHAGGSSTVTTAPDGSYVCPVAVGAVAIQVAGSVAGTCPHECAGPCDAIECDVSVSHPPCGPSSLALLLVVPPGLLWVRRRRRL